MLESITIKPEASIEDIAATLLYVSGKYVPPTPTCYSLKVPMAFFNRNEKAIRRWMKAEGYRLFYRGPRCQTTYVRKCKVFGQYMKQPGQLLVGTPATTRRENATHVVFSGGYR